MKMNYFYKINVKQNSLVSLTSKEKNKNTKILVICSVKDLKRFEKQFLISNKGLIDWKRVSRTCGGIEIRNYELLKTHAKHWLSIWDCSSGCIWNTEIVGSIEEI